MVIYKMIKLNLRSIAICFIYKKCFKEKFYLFINKIGRIYVFFINALFLQISQKISSKNQVLDKSKFV